MWQACLRAVAVQHLDLGARQLRDERVDVLGARERRAEEVPGGVGRGVAVVALVPVRLQDDHRPVEEVVHHLREDEEKNNTDMQEKPKPKLRDIASPRTDRNASRG